MKNPSYNLKSTLIKVAKTMGLCFVETDTRYTLQKTGMKVIVGKNPYTDEKCRHYYRATVNGKRITSNGFVMLRDHPKFLAYIFQVTADKA